MKESLLILAAALAMVSCGGNAQQKAATAGTQQTTAAAPDMHNAETSLDYLGVYKGTLPAADCPGIETTLTLAPDGSYALHQNGLSASCSTCCVSRRSARSPSASPICSVAPSFSRRRS